MLIAVSHFFLMSVHCTSPLSLTSFSVTFSSFPPSSSLYPTPCPYPRLETLGVRTLKELVYMADAFPEEFTETKDERLSSLLHSLPRWVVCLACRKSNGYYVQLSKQLMAEYPHFCFFHHQYFYR